MKSRVARKSKKLGPPRTLWLFEGVIKSPTAAIVAATAERDVHGSSRDRARPKHEQRVLVPLPGSVPMRVLQTVDPEGGQYEQDRARSAVHSSTHVSSTILNGS